MYSIPPALVSALFLGYGLYVIVDGGLNRVSISFFFLCLTTFLWQAAWAILFQIEDPASAMFLIKIGHLAILFLPTSFYHFLVELSGRESDRRYVFASYGFTAILAFFLLTSDLFIDGYYQYFWGYFPKAGMLYPVHIIQTVILMMRGLYIIYSQQKISSAAKRTKLRVCMVGIIVYFFAAFDYLGSYGGEFYPTGFAFTAISLGIIAIAVVKYDLMDSMTMTATVAHEIRTPLLNIRMQAMSMAKFWPELYKGYQLAVQHGLCEPAIRPVSLERLSSMSQDITHEIDRSNIAIDMMLASAAMEQVDIKNFGYHSVDTCLAEVLKRYPFDPNERRMVNIVGQGGFEFFGSDTLLVYVFFNLLKNALHSLKKAGKGQITIALSRQTNCNSVQFTDTGTGIPENILPYVFDAFFTTKKTSGSGIGLAFCRQVMTAFGGRIYCESIAGQYTTFFLEFPHVVQKSADHSHAGDTGRTTL